MRKEICVEGERGLESSFAEDENGEEEEREEEDGSYAVKKILVPRRRRRSRKSCSCHLVMTIPCSVLINKNRIPSKHDL